MHDENFILKIQTSYNRFTKAEKKVADYVMLHQKEVIFMSITDLADACKVGDTSVYRFCRTMNLQGYQEFKMQLSFCQGANPGRKKQYQGNYSIDDSLGVMAEKVMQVHMSAIKETYMLLNQDSFNKTMNLFEEARQVYFFGIGDSLLTAEEARNKFLRITGKVSCITDPHMQAMAASMTTNEDLVIIISYSGATKDNIQVAKMAKQAGAKIVCITHFQKSPLTAYSDAILLCGSNEGPLDGGSMSAKMSQLYLIDLMFQEFYDRNYDACKENNQRTSTAVLEKLY